jgi:mRNA interferase HigB
MNVIALRRLRAFWKEYPEAQEPLRVWYRRLCKSEPQNFAELKDQFNGVDLDAPFTIFDISGNNYRVIVVIVYISQVAFIKHVFTHNEYDQWNRSKAKKLEKKPRKPS